MSRAPPRGSDPSAVPADVNGSRSSTSRMRAARGLSFGAGMELGPSSPQGEEDLRRNEQDGQHRGRQAEGTTEEAEPEHHRDESDAQPGDELHAERRKKRTAQCRHRALSERFPRLFEPRDAHRRGGCTPCRESLNELEQPGRQRAEATPLARTPFGGLFAEVDHGDRHRARPVRRAAASRSSRWHRSRQGCRVVPAPPGWPGGDRARIIARWPRHRGWRSRGVRRRVGRSASLARGRGRGGAVGPAGRSSHGARCGVPPVRSPT